LVEVVLESIVEPQSLRGMVIIAFHDIVKAVPAARSGRGRDRTPRIGEMERETRRLRDELQTTREEMQSSQEELKSANEELQSANEELQSTNEELTTSKEEMQSLNEELQTVNAELQSKVDDLSRASSDMKNLLDSTDIATLFLDSELRVRRFTSPTTRIIKLIAADVGRPLSDITSDLDYPGLQDDAREVLRTLIYSEKQVACDDGRWFAVRIMPYRTLDNNIDGVVITFSDITKTKTLESELRGTRNAA
jgi:two-component system CheB/CheR fusion protein